MSDDDIPEPDRAEGLPHPRHTAELFGHAQAETAFLDAWTSGKLHHGWLIAGPRGVGKATLAWKIARFVLSQPDNDGGGLFGAPEPPATLDTPPDHPVAHRVAALGEPRLFLLRRAWNEKDKKLKTVITVDEVRRLKSFLTLSATDGGWRVAIVDPADEMNPNAANALLKLLEEPPARVLILLVAHQPARLLPTIRSRCRTLRCAPLAPDDQALALRGAGVDPGDAGLALAELSGGSVGTAARLLAQDGLAVYGKLVSLLSGAPGLDRGAVHGLAQGCAGAANAQRYDLVVTLLAQMLARLSRFGALQPAQWTEAAPDEARTLSRLAPNPAAGRHWAELAAELEARITHARGVNIDATAVILDALLRIDTAARR